MIAPMVVEGAMTGEMFLAYIEKCLVPMLTQPGSWANSVNLPAACGTALNTQCGGNDADAVLLPSGNVLMFAGPVRSGTNEFPNGGNFIELDRTVNPPVWNQATMPAGLATQVSTDPSYVGAMMQLPNGQVLFTDGINVNSGIPRNGVWTYAPQGSPNPAWQPVITSAPTVITRNQTYTISGFLFNGMSQANFYGDDFQNATNYPIVQVTMNAAPNHVYYGRTHDHSAMGVARTNLPVSTKFELWYGDNGPGNLCAGAPTPPQLAPGAACVPETGAATLRVIANGIASAPVQVTIQ
jgi:hypothetical protein